MSGLSEAFRERFGNRPWRHARAPGRVNLIGEHTDYNDGFVLPVAIDRYVHVAYAKNEAGALRGFSVDFDEERAASVDELRPREGADWFDYAAGAAWVFREDCGDAPGIDFVVAGDVPMGAGVSSSAAFELAMLRALYDAASLPWDGRAAAVMGQRVENDYIGLQSGIMDQMASALSEPNTAMLLDCRDLSIERVSLPNALTIAVMDTGTRRRVAESAYNDRRDACERVAAKASVPALRDLSSDALEALRDEVSETDYRRALHVIRENGRTVETAEALERGETRRLGELLRASHESLRELYEVSSPALDRIVEIARAHAACLGARMMGAGFGGSALALVREDGSDAFVSDVETAYKESTNASGQVFLCRAVAGAEILP